MAVLSYNPPVLDLVVYAGDDTFIPLNVSANSVGVNLTGVHTAQIRKTRDGELLGTFSIDTSAANIGVIKLLLNSEVADTLINDDSVAIETDYFGNELITAPMFRGVWDWNYTVDTITRTLVQGQITVIKDVTR
jgi:hypothetical protein